MKAAAQPPERRGPATSTAAEGASHPGLQPNIPVGTPAGASAQNVTTFANLNAAYAANKNVSHSIFQAAVKAANLTDAVLNVSSFTMFIPSDEVRDGVQLAARSL
jgi:uncharacterized surface protein with fasciclin (FAS1) repeats